MTGSVYDHDDYFGLAVFDIDEARDAPFHHRFVHGSFAGTETKFSMYFPFPEAYEGRILQYLEGGTGGSEYASVTNGGFDMAAEIGAVLIESNQGHVGFGTGGELGDVEVPQSVMDWRASAETLRLAKKMATEFYGSAPRACYLYGASGGGVRTIAAIEAAPGLWDGAIAAVINRAPLHLYNWSLHALTALLIDGHVEAVVDACDAGGTGDPFAVLTTDAQRRALANLYAAGYCRGAESQLTANPFMVLALNLMRPFDPSFADDFWAAVDAGTITPEVKPFRHTATVKGVVSPIEILKRPDWEDISRALAMISPAPGPAGIVLDVELTNAEACGAVLRFTSGAAAGRSVIASGVVDGAVTAALTPGGLEGVSDGDTVEIDNTELVAFAHYHRHIADPSLAATAQNLVDGRPVYGTRPAVVGLPTPTGVFEGKLALIQNAADRECWPNALQPFVDTLRDGLGAAFDDRIRVWWMANAAHHPPMSPRGSTRLVPWTGKVAQAIADVAAWVEDGAVPPPSTNYELDDDQALVLPPTAGDRLGLQPVITMPARVEARAGAAVTITATIEAPPGTGAVVAVAWDPDGAGAWPFRHNVTTGAAAHTAELTHTYEQPGTYFAVCRGSVHRDGPGAANARRNIDNLARCRVVVT